MIYEVEVSEQADRDLREIFENIAFELQSPENAIGQLDRLEEQILSLDAMPKRYRKYEKEPWKSRELHILPVDNYVILYIPNSDKKVVTILRVMYAGRNLSFFFPVTYNLFQFLQCQHNYHLSAYWQQEPISRKDRIITDLLAKGQ